MRRRGALFSLALVLIGGCAESRESSLALSQARWQSIQNRFAVRRAPGPTPVDAVASGKPLSGAVACRARQSVVWIATVQSTPTPGGPQSQGKSRVATSIGGGTGFVIDPAGVILTNAHVIREAASSVVVTPDGNRHMIEASRFIPGVDLAVVKIARHDLPAMTLSAASVRVGSWVAAICGREQGNPVRHGVLAATSASLQASIDPRKRCDYSRLLESTTDIEPGFSGGPLLDGEGRLVGVNVAMAGRGDSLRGYAIPLTPAHIAAIHSAAAQVLNASMPPGAVAAGSYPR